MTEFLRRVESFVHWMTVIFVAPMFLYLIVMATLMVWRGEQGFKMLLLIILLGLPALHEYAVTLTLILIRWRERKHARALWTRHRGADK